MLSYAPKTQILGFFCKCPARYYREIIESSKMVKKNWPVYKKENGFLFCLFRPIFIVDKDINFKKW